MQYSSAAKCKNEKQQSIYRVEQRDTEVLDDAVQSHELEHAERCNEGSSALPVEEIKKIRDNQNSKAEYFTFLGGVICLV